MVHPIVSRCTEYPDVSFAERRGTKQKAQLRAALFYHLWARSCQELCFAKRRIV